MNMQMTDYPVNDTFNVGFRNNVSITGWSEPSGFTPKVDPDYQHREDLLRDMLGFWFSGERAMMIIGHSGCGKTSGVEQWHAKLNLPLLVINAHPRTEIADLIGHYLPTADGGMAYHYGPVAKAAKEGLSILIDEYFVLDPGVATGLNALLQGGMLYIQETGEVIWPADGFRVFASTNPADVGAGYFGRNTQDAANQDRFWTIKMGYPTPEEEIPLVTKTLMAGMEDESVATLFAEKMVDVANRVRKQYCGESDAASALDITFSTRSLKRWAALFTLFDVDRPEHYALERAVTNRASSETAKAIHDIVDIVFGTT